MVLYKNIPKIFTRNLEIIILTKWQDIASTYKRISISIFYKILLVNIKFSSKSHTEKDIIDTVLFTTVSKNKISGTKLNRRDEMLL